MKSSTPSTVSLGVPTAAGPPGGRSAVIRSAVTSRRQSSPALSGTSTRPPTPATPPKDEAPKSTSRSASPERSSATRAWAGNHYASLSETLKQLEAHLNNCTPVITLFRYKDGGLDEAGMRRVLDCFRRSGNGSLRELTIRTTSISSGALSKMLAFDGNWATNLVSLNMDHCGLNDACVNSLVDLLRRPSSLKVMHLRQNQLGPPSGMKIAAAIERCSLEELDLADNDFGTDVGIHMAKAICRSDLRVIDVSHCGMSDQAHALIQAAKTFVKDVWLGMCSSEEDLFIQARRANLQPAINTSQFKISELKSFMEGIDHFWPTQNRTDFWPPSERKGRVADVLAALHAPMCFADPQNRGICGYSDQAIRQLASIYLPNWMTGKAYDPGEGYELQLPSDLHCRKKKTLVLNLTPFHIGFSSSSSTAPKQDARAFSGLWVNLSDLRETDLNLSVNSGTTFACLVPGFPANGEKVTIRFAVGERRYDVSAAAQNGTLRAMFSEVEAIAESGDCIVASMLTLVWSQPSRLRGVDLKELNERWTCFQDEIVMGINRPWIPIDNMQLDRIILWSKADRDMFVHAKGRAAQAVKMSNNFREPQFLKLMSGPNKSMRFMGHDGCFLTATEDGVIWATDCADSAEQWDVHNHNDGSISIESRRFAGTFVSLDTERGLLGTMDGAKRTNQKDDHVRFFASEGPNMYMVKDAWILPATGAAQSSFAALFSAGSVSVFVSHYWGQSFQDTMRSLTRYERVLSADHSLMAPRYWICSFANNQRRIEEELGTNVDLSPFMLALGCDTCSAMALMFGLKGAPLKRFWCLFEIMTVIELQGRPDKADIMFDICTPHGVATRGEASIERLMDVGKTVADINVENAQCSNPKDRKRIEEKIHENLGPDGYGKMNEAVRAKVAAGLSARQDRLDKEMREVHSILAAGTPGASPSAIGSRLDDLASLRLELAARDEEVAQLKMELKAKDAEIKRQRQTIKMQAGIIKSRKY